MPSARALKRYDNLVWALIFGGLLVLVLGIASHDEAAIAGWSLTVVGGMAAVAGIVMIFVRSRMRETPEADAQSKPRETQR
ncbi:MAG TPA: hypothetical protein VF522_15265 [Ramlibacter sp.]|uniref:hypothetical protein n=1 Tax=Ramlibacter sp. TaxID=1917967 RepID=UPI002ED6B1DD